MSSDRSVDQLIKLTLDETYEGLQIISTDWRYQYVNKAAAAQGHQSPSLLIGKTMMECYPGIDRTPFFKDLKYVMEKRIPKRIENEFHYPDGSKCWFELFIEPHAQGVLIRSLDISDRKRIEDQLLQSQKMEAIGRLAGGVAHDFNNKLGVMLVYAEMILQQVQGQPQLEEYVEKILNSIDESAAIAKQLLAFCGRQVLDLKYVDLNSVLVNFRKGINRFLGENIQVECVYAEKLNTVHIDPVQFQQAILNLCINARDAMPSGGRLTIETANVELDDDFVKDHLNMISGPYVMVAVTDTGTGMPPEVVGRVFEPFFTTKPTGLGTGLGLAMVYGFVNQSNGHIWVYSEPGKGSVFKIYLPVDDSQAQAVEAPLRVPLKSLDGTGHVLLVEDDEHLRNAFGEALRNSGYTVYVATDGEDGLKVFNENKDKIDLILTDLVMPNLSGHQMFKEIQKAKKDLRVIYMSGYTENTIVHGGILDTESVLLQKPFSIQRLLETLRLVFDGKLKKGVI